MPAMINMIKLSIIFVILANMPVDNGHRHQIYLPLVQGGSGAYIDIIRYVRDGFPTYPWEWEEWCNGDIPCTTVSSLLPEFIHSAPKGEIVSFARIYIRDLVPGGAHILYPFDGCFAGICIIGINAPIESRQAVGIRLYLDMSDDHYWKGSIEVLDVCHELTGVKFGVVCDGKEYTFIAKPQLSEGGKK